MGKRVALISEHASPLAVLGGVDSGGQNVYVAQVARCLSLAGWEVDVFTRRDSRFLPVECEFCPGVRIVNVPAGPARFIPKENMLSCMDEFTAYMVEYFSRKEEYSIIHANFFMSGLVALRLKRIFDIPFVITFHALGKVRRFFQGGEDRFPDQRFGIEERIVKEASGLIAESPQDWDDLIRLYGADPRRIRIIPCGYDPNELWPVEKAQARRRLGLPENERIVLQLGRIVPRKGIDTLIRSFSCLQKEYKIQALLAIVGGLTKHPDSEATPEIRRLQAVAREEEVLDRVLFLGRANRDELRYYYSAADVFVTVPWYEPFGITPLEAMACGTPVIGSRVGGIKFSVKDNETGYLVPPQNAPELSRSLARIFQYPEQTQNFRAKAIERARLMFPWERITDAIMEYYEELSGQHLLQADAKKFSSAFVRLRQVEDDLV